MKIGTLTLEVYGELLTRESISLLQKAMYRPLISICDTFHFDYRRFEYLAATIIWIVPLKIFWKNDLIFRTLRRTLSKYFFNWEIDLTLIIHESGE